MTRRGNEIARDLRRLAKAKTAVLLTALTAIAGVVGHLVLGPAGVWLALSAVGVMLIVGLRSPADLPLRLQGGYPIGPWEAPALAQIVEHLARWAGIAVPRLYLIPSEVPNALAAGGGRARGALGVTQGALRILNPDELQGVLAHEMAHLKNEDTQILQLAGLVTASVTALLRIAVWTALFVSILAGPDLMSDIVQLAVVAAAAPLALGLVQAALSRTREHAADATAATLTGNPRALASALVKLARHESRWFRFLVGGRPSSSYLSTHPPTKERVRRLLAMAEPAPVAAPVRMPRRSVARPVFVAPRTHYPVPAWRLVG